MTHPNRFCPHWLRPIVAGIVLPMLAVALVGLRSERLAAGEELATDRHVEEPRSSNGAATADEGRDPAWGDRLASRQRPANAGFRRPPLRDARDAYNATDDSEQSGIPIHEGFVFIDGEYVSAPYVLRSEGGIQFVNDRPISPTTNASVPGRFGASPRWPSRVPRIAAFDIEDGSVVWVENGRPHVLHRTADGYVFLKYVLGEGAGLSPFDVEAFSPALLEKVRAFPASPDLLARARTQVDRMESVWANEASAKSAQSLLEQLHYPMTMIGLLVAATAVGHLFTSWPSLGGALRDPEVDARRAKIVWRSMAFVFVLSGLDLVWTILASRSGAMTELNPLAARFITDPMVLTYFKIIATGVGITLLLGLRRHHAAQTASLWLCLVCTLLTFRWLTFTSLFAS